jgi:hypothetical protein
MTFTDFRTRMTKTLADLTRPRGAAGLIRRAEQARRDGHFDEASELVTLALRASPQHVLGHLLLAYLHVASRNPEPAKMAFAHVLSLDSQQPRALLGLARIALDEGDHWSCKAFLERALKFFPEFPEAAALLDAVSGASLPAPRPARELLAGATSPALRRTPPGGRDLVLTRDDGSVLLSEVDADRARLVAAHAMQTLRLASTTLARCGLGALRRSVIEFVTEATFTRGEDGLTLSVTLPRGGEVGAGTLAIDNLWTDIVAPLEETAASDVSVGVPA